MRSSSEPHPVSGRHPGPRDPLVGTWLDGRYLIEERIATGGFGAVYRARTPAGAPLALKVLHPSLTADPNAVARFEREGATLTRLHDPHTVTTLAVGETGDGTRYIAMELLTGESLHARLVRERALPWQTAVAIARAVCSSLAEAHAIGVIHRDLKPDNICVEQRGGAELVKVIDFGIVKFAPGSAIDDGKELTCAGYMIGTYDYMSPEQIVGDACDAASDLYSLGVVLYEMLTGQRPFARLATPAAMMTALLTQTPLPPSVFAAVPPALDRIVMRCLEREPAQRLSSAVELAAALERLLERRLTAREEITAIHPVFPGASRAAPSCATWSDGWLRSAAGEDAAICRDLGAPSVDPTEGSAARPAGRAVGLPSPRLAAMDPTGGSAPRPAGRAVGLPSPCLAAMDPTGGSAPHPAGRAVGLPSPCLAAMDPTGGSAPRPAGRAVGVPTPCLAALEWSELGGRDAPRWTDPRGMPAVAPPRSSSASVSPSAPVPGPVRRTARGSVRALGSFDSGATLPGVAVATERRSQPRIAEPAEPAELAGYAAPAALLRPSAEMMLAPSIPAVPLIRLARGSRPTLPSPSSSAALLIGAALVAAVASFLLATLL